MFKYTGDSRRDIEKASAEIIKLKERIDDYQDEIRNLRRENNRLREAKDILIKKYKDELDEKNAIIYELKNRLAHAEALNNHDGTNTGMPTSQTPAGKNKVIPNSRRSKGMKKGGQPGHVKHSLHVSDDVAVTEVLAHKGEEAFCCSKCSSKNYTATDQYEVKYEYDVRVNVVKVEHRFYYYQCSDCGNVFRSPIPPSLNLNSRNKFRTTH